MAIKDFVRNQAHTAQTHGLGAAVRSGAAEVTLKALAPAATRLLARPIWADDWDVCLVLDACRADLWAEVATHHPNFKTQCGRGRDTAWSVGSASPEWIANTFADSHREAWATAGYVTANPFSAKRPENVPFVDANAYPLADRGLAYLDEVWHDQWPARDDLPTVDPNTLTGRALWAWKRRDALEMDRLVVHYMQPHIPFRSRPEWCAGWNLEGFGTGGGYGEKDDWKKVRDGEIDAAEFWAAYRDNLEWVLESVERWRQVTDATILVTSDHGNAMGEYGQWSHPPNSANPVLRRVPWVTVHGLNIREPEVEPAGDPPVLASTDRGVQSRLEALGYVG